MWPLFGASVLIAISAFVYALRPSDPDTDEGDSEDDDETDSDVPDSTEGLPGDGDSDPGSDSTEGLPDDGSDPLDYDDADVYVDDDAQRKRARRARVPKVRS